ncbi:MAG TPA: DUF2252 family protein [Candidatus Acidoferrales bacterium]
MNIVKATQSFDGWKAARTQIIKADLELKHRRMAEAPFLFFRATFYRWVQLWEEVCPDEAKAPSVLAVGDLHVENFGTWRDLEGRLIWGVNDFDEVYPMAYTNDLVRLAVSAHLAVEAEDLDLSVSDVCGAILEGYREGLAARGKAFVLAEDNRWLRLIALNQLRDPVRFWKRAKALEDFTGNIPTPIKVKLEEDLPEKDLPYVKKRRVAGLGSLGHMRVLALASWRGGFVAREAKAIAPSACIWAQGGAKSEKILYPDILSRAVRVPDPFLHLFDTFLVRRLAPDCSRILLALLPEDHDETRLLKAMGFETANIHLGTPAAIPAILRDLKDRPRRWLHRTSKKMLKAIKRDWKKWRAES